METCFLPWLPQNMGKEANQECPHSEIEIACRIQTPHACVDQRESSSAIFSHSYPGRNDRLFQIIVRFIQRLKFHAAFHFKFLNEMRVPP